MRIRASLCVEPQGPPKLACDQRSGMRQFAIINTNIFGPGGLREKGKGERVNSCDSSHLCWRRAKSLESTSNFFMYCIYASSSTSYLFVVVVVILFLLQNKTDFRAFF